MSMIGLVIPGYFLLTQLDNLLVTLNSAMGDFLDDADTQTSLFFNSLRMADLHLRSLIYHGHNYIRHHGSVHKAAMDNDCTKVKAKTSVILLFMSVMRQIKKYIDKNYFLNGHSIVQKCPLSLMKTIFYYVEDFSNKMFL